MLNQNLFLLKQIIHGEFQVRYRKSFLGLLWLFLEPLVSVVIWVFLFKVGIIHPGKSSVSYPSYLLISTSLWAIFHQSFVDSSTTIKAHQRVFLTVKTDPIIYGISKIVLSFFYSFIPLILILAVLSFGSLTFQVSWLGVIILVLPLLLVGGALGLLNSLFATVSQDINRVFNFCVQMLKYATPIVYTNEVSNDLLQTIIGYNPLTYLINAPRNILLSGGSTDWSAYVMITLGAIGLFSLSVLFFRNKSKLIIERVIN